MLSLPISVLQAAVASDVLDSTRFPAIADELMMEGNDGPAVVALASLSTEPFDPREAREAARCALDELNVPAMDQSDAYDMVAALGAAMLLAGRTTPRELTAFCHKRIMHHRASPLIAELLNTEDMWDEGWSPLTNEDLETGVRALARRLCDAFPAVSSVASGDVPTWLEGLIV